MRNRLVIPLFIVFLSLFSAYPEDPNVQAVDAVNRNKLIRLKSALKKGADINLADRDGNTLLMKAIEKNYYNIAEYLVDSNADLNIRNKAGRSAMEIAVDKKNGDIISLLEDKVRIDDLKAKINSITEFNLTGTNRDNLGVFDLKYKDQTIGIKFLTQEIFGFITTLFKVYINQIEFKGDIKVSGRKLQTNTLDFNINNQVIAGTITSDYYEDMKKTYNKFTLNVSAGGEKLEGEVMNKISDKKMLYMFKLDKAEKKMMGIRYSNGFESLYDIKINDSRITGRKTNKGDFYIYTDVSENYLYLFLLIDVYFDYLNFVIKN